MSNPPNIGKFQCCIIKTGVKKLKQHTTLLSLLLLVAATAGVFWQFFLKGLSLFPGNYLLAWFEPYKTDNINASGSFILLAHKPVAEDAFKLIYPFKVLAVGLMKHLQFPLWNPYNGAGMPLLAAINPGYFDPFNLLYFIFSSPFAWTLVIILQTILIAVFTYLYAKSIKQNNYAAIFAAVIFTLSGAVVTRLTFSVFTLGLALLPLCLYLLEKYREKSQIKYLTALALAIGVLLISTHLQYAVYILAFVGIYWLVRGKYEMTAAGLKNFLLPLPFVLLGLGLAAVQLVPTFELFRYANLNTNSSSFIFNQSLVPVIHLVTILIPNYFGSPATYNFWGPIEYIETAVYLGLIPCLFVCLALLKLKDKVVGQLVKLFFITAFLTLLICLRLPFIPWLYSLNLPFFSIGVPTRIFFLTSFSLTILAGFGFNYLLELKSSRKKLLTMISIFSILAGLFFVFTVVNLHSACPTTALNCRVTALRNTLIELGGFVALLVLIFAYFIFGSKKSLPKRLLPLLMILIVYLLGFYNAYKFLPFSPQNTFFPQNQVVNRILQIAKTNRVFAVGDAGIIPNFATDLHFYDTGYIDPLYIKRYGELISYANTGVFPPPLFRSDVNIRNDATLSATLQAKRERLFTLLNVNYLLYKNNELAPSSSNTVVWKNSQWTIVQRTKTLPRVYLVNKLILAHSAKVDLQTLFSPSFNPAETVVVEQNFPGLAEIMKSGQTGNASIKSYNENNVSITTNSPVESFLVLADNYYPGWKAFVDGKAVPVYRTDYTLRGVAVSAGKHNVYFVYDPLSFKLGLLLSVFSGIVILILFLGILLKSRNKLPLLNYLKIMLLYFL
jgi:hypothetical protein